MDRPLIEYRNMKSSPIITTKYEKFKICKDCIYCILNDELLQYIICSSTAACGHYIYNSKLNIFECEARKINNI
jgi:hypothetical protein